jgi:DNA-binding NtrC family response regulator
MVMPGLDGAKSLEQILRIRPSAKVVIITGFTTEDAVYEMAKRNAVEIIEKPFDLSKLMDAIKHTIYVGDS